MIIKDDESLSEGTAGIPQKEEQRPFKSGKAEIAYHRSLEPVDDLSHVNWFKVKTHETFGVDGEDSGGADPEKEDDVASGEVRTHHDGGYDGETRASGKNVMGGESEKRTWDEFVEGSVKTSKKLANITTAIELALDIIAELGDSEITDKSQIGEEHEGCKRRRLGEFVKDPQISKAKLLLRFTQKEIRDLELDFDRLLEEGFAQYSVLSRPMDVCGTAVESLH